MVLSLVRRRPIGIPHSISPVFASRYIQDPVPRYVLSTKSVSKDAAYQIIHDELLLDSSPRLNLASFVTTWMEPECEK